jgi:hypothetical protein
VAEIDQVVESKELESLVTAFQVLFEQPKSLAPSIPFDHHIPLVPCAILINARSYRYSPPHKTETEKQVADLLKSGLIVPSVSPFASIVLLVQKKDGT